MERDVQWFCLHDAAHALNVKNSKFSPWQLQVGLGKDPCLKPCSANASQNTITM